MECIRIERYGGPDVVLRQEVPVPTPGPDEVLVRVRHAGINFMDVHTRQGKYATSTTYPVRAPCTLGMEGAGEVVSWGDQVQDFQAGQRVAWCLSWGSYAHFAAVPASRLCPVPQDLPLDVAATTIFPGCTAHYLLHDVARLGPGQRCLVHAASGVIGQMLVQWAHRLGAQVFATASTLERAHIAKACGAEQVFAYADVASGLMQATRGEGVDVVFDAIGRDTLRTSFQVTRKKGLVVNYGAVSGPLSDLDPLELGEAGSLFLTRPRLADHLADAQTLRRRASDVFTLLASGDLKFQIAQRYTLDTVLQAHHALEARRAVGKAVLDLPHDS